MATKKPKEPRLPSQTSTAPVGARNNLAATPDAFRASSWPFRPASSTA